MNMKPLNQGPSYEKKIQFPLITALVFLVALAGCTTVEVKKVPSKTQYEQVWDDPKQADRLQQRADRIRGNRYYLPRPFVSVYEPFVVDSSVYFLNGLVSADGKYILLGRLKQNAAEGLAGLIQGESVNAKIPAAILSAPIKPPENNGTAQSATSKLDQGTVSTGATEGGVAVDTGAGARTSQAPGPSKKTGQTSIAVTNDNTAFALTPMRRYFDVAFLPDFDEQYAVVVRQGLGNAKTNLALGQGWSLQGLGVELDNQAVTDVVLDLFKTAADAAKTAGLNALGLPVIAAGSGTVAVPVLDTGTAVGAPQAGAAVTTDKPLLLGGQPVTIKITLVDYAAPGLYPLLKPREVREIYAGNEPGNRREYMEFWLKYSNKPAFDTFRYAVVEPVVTGVATGIPINGGALGWKTGGDNRVGTPSGNADLGVGTLCPETNVKRDDVGIALEKAKDHLNKPGEATGLNSDNDPNRHWLIEAFIMDPSCNIVAKVKPKSADHPPQNSNESTRKIIRDYLKNGAWYVEKKLKIEFPVGTEAEDGIDPAG